MRSVTGGVLVVLLSLFSVQIFADIDSGLAAFERGDYATALKELQPLARKGDARAQTRLGYMYQDGKGVEPDDRQAVQWFRKAAERGDVNAQVQLALHYMFGKGVKEDAARGIAWLRKGAESGSPWPQLFLGLSYLEGRGVPQDNKQAVEWFRKSAEQREADALGALVKMAEEGDPSAQVALGKFYVAGRIIARNDTKAVEWFRKAAESNDAEALYLVGKMHLRARGVENDCNEARKLFDRAQQQGLNAAELNDEYTVWCGQQNGD